MPEFSLTIIGCGSALPMHGRHPSSQVVRYGELNCLVDCGEGTQERLKTAGIKPFKIDIILISHLHGDHVFGLPGLLSSYSHLKRANALIIYGPPGLKGFLNEIIRYTELKISYPLRIVEKDPKRLSRIHTEEDFEIMTFPLYHRIPCNGYLFRETKPLIKLRKEAVQELQLTIEEIQSLKQGKDINLKGRKITNDKLAYGPVPPVSYAYCSDTRYDRRILASIKGVSVLYHETTFMQDMNAMAEQTGHSTSLDAATVAKDAGVSCLITGHYSSRYKEVEELVDEARAYFEHSIVSEEGKRYNLRELAKGQCKESSDE